MTTETHYREFNRNESRFLEFACLSVVMVININAFACNVFEVAAYLAAVGCFVVFNVLRKGEGVEYLRLLFFVPLVVAYVPFYVESKTLKTS
jgi:hypothetical protein